MSFAVTFGKLVVFLAKYDCMHVIRKLASDPDVESGLHGKEELKAIEAVRRIVQEFDLGSTWSATLYEILDDKGELLAEQIMKKRQRYESEAVLWAEGQALLTTDEDEDELATDEHKFSEQEQCTFEPTSPAFSPTSPIYSVPAFWVDDL